ncbi:Histidine kinase [Sulfidibacter corallicola]|uniref:histidine kinase n=1 Tax=Sulfidibacter corallicola TaxID=2818388 RepID=A0A8A4TET4_SULCO|nr:ATP-binding protein [Sulfidibacter corallicola]QTD47724.1 ATP-binding protein [Sulfidibacter corallicola]
MSLKSILLLGHPSIARRLLFYILLYSSLITLGATATQLYLYYHGDMDQLNDRFEQIDASFVKSITDDLWNIDFQQVRVHLEGIHKLPDIEYVRVDPVDFDSLEVGTPMETATKVRKVALYFDKDGTRNYLGELTVVASLEGIYARLREKVLIVLTTQAIKTFLVSAFMLFIFNFIIIRHLEKIAGFAHNFSLDKPIENLTLDRSATRGGNDELDQVVQAFNEMQLALQQSYEELLTANKELAHHKQNLERLVEERTIELREAEQTLLENAHQAGMAEIAIGVLHHIGNTLNSLNISGHVIHEILAKSSIDRLERANSLLAQHRHDLVDFISTDPRGLKLLTYYLQIGERLLNEHDHLTRETTKLEEYIKQIKDAIFSQQEYARISSFTQAIRLEDLLDEALRLESFSLTKLHIKVEKDLQKTPRLYAPTTKVRFVLLQLLRNAREALDHKECENRRITLKLRTSGSDAVSLSVRDNGIGIAPENLVNIFKSGYTTKQGSQGFGLHVCANAVSEMGGSLTVDSGGLGQGAVFTVTLPVVVSQAAKAS